MGGDEEMLLTGGSGGGLIRRGRKCGGSSKRCLFAVLLGVGFLGSVWISSSLRRNGASDIVMSSPGPMLELLLPSNIIDYESIQKDNFRFHLNGSDVLIFLHIQKTGGTTFGKHLVQDIDIHSPCSCRKKSPKKHGNFLKKKLKCDCFRPGSKKTWLFSRYSTGWKCGLHSDWTELTSCVDPYLRRTEGPAQRRYFYITFLRDPVSRYLSEFRHVQRGATWKASRHVCNGRPATREEIPPCYSDQRKDWEGVSLEEFMNCSSNLAVNRMTRMLADLTLVGCYNASAMSRKKRDLVLLESAKRNLESMAFFGLTERQEDSQFLFQRVFNLDFKIKFIQYQRAQGTSTLESLSSSIFKRVLELNHLDVQLYNFAKELMDKRIQSLKKKEANEKELFSENEILDDDYETSY